MVSYLGFFIGMIVGIAFCVGIPNMAPTLRKMVINFRNQRSKSSPEEKKKIESKLETYSLGGKKLEYY